MHTRSVAPLLGAACALALAGPGHAETHHAAVRPTQYWCEVYAQAAMATDMTPEEASRGFFFSQIIEKPRPRRDEEDRLEGRCRRSFEVQFGGQWTLGNARVFSAPTYHAAETARLADMNDGVRRGHTREFRMAE